MTKRAQGKFERKPRDFYATPRDAVLPLVDELLSALEAGMVRAAEPADGAWVVHAWVKQGILLGFRVGRLRGTPAREDPRHHRPGAEPQPPRALSC